MAIYLNKYKRAPSTANKQFRAVVRTAFVDRSNGKLLRSSVVWVVTAVAR